MKITNLSLWLVKTFLPATCEEKTPVHCSSECANCAALRTLKGAE